MSHRTSRLLLLLLAGSLAHAQQPQAVEGFARVLFAHNDHSSATIRSGLDFRGNARAYMTAGWWAPGQLKDNRLEWETAAPAAARDSVFTFIGSSSPLPPAIPQGPELDLFIDGKLVLTFSIGLQREWSWRSADGAVRLAYHPVRNEWTSWGRQRQFELEGNSGYYDLRVPAALLTAGKPLRLKVVMKPLAAWPNGWFMVKGRTDALDRGPAELRSEVDQLRTDVNRLAELVHVLATRDYGELSGQDRFEHRVLYTNGYRHIHPADLIPLRGGALLMTAREGTEHVAADGDIVVLRSDDQGRQWRRAARFGVPGIDEREACGIQLADGTILLTVFYNALYRADGEYEQKWYNTVKLGAGKQYLGFYTVTSKDGGATWSEPRYHSTKGMPFTDTEGPADSPIQLPSGELLLPLIAYNVRGDIDNHASILMRSADQGASWQYLSTIADDPGGKLNHFHEPGLLRLRSGELLAAMRNNSGYIWTSRSKDNGHTWTQAKPTNMVGHPADLIQLADGRVVCTYGVRAPHHASPGGIRASISRDEGETWKVDDDVIIRADLLNWDVGYPESIQLPDGKVLTVYYYNLLGRYFLGGSFWKP